MMVAPPGEPVPMTNSPRALSLPLRNTSVGAIELRGRLPASSLLAIGLPCASVGLASKSVSWLFRMKPCVKWNEPMPDSTVVVMDTTLPRRSTMVKCVVPASLTRLVPKALVPSTPALAVPMLRVVLISAARLCR